MHPAVAPSAAAQGQPPLFFGIEPGTTSKAEVDLILGEPLRRVEELVYEYPPPRDVTDARSIRVRYFAEGQLVARLDVRLDVPLDPTPLRERFGTRVLTEETESGGREEYFFPQTFGLVFEESLPGSPAVAIGYLSRRALADVYVERYNAHMAADEVEEARSAADTAVLVAPDYARGYGAQGHFLARQGQPAQAVERYRLATAAEYTPGFRGRAFGRLASLYWRELQEFERAEAAYDEALVLAPDLAEVQEEYARFLLDRNRTEEAIEPFERAARLSPDDAGIKLGLGYAHSELDNYAAALPIYEGLAEWVESEAGQGQSVRVRRSVWYRVGWCLQQLEERPDDALRAFDRAIEIDPEYVSAYWGAGIVLRRQGRAGSAVSYLRRAVAIDPDTLGLSQHLTHALLDAGNHEAALEEAMRGQRLDPDHKGQMINVATCYAALRKKNEARQWLWRAVNAGYADRGYLTRQEHIQALLGRDGEFRRILDAIQ